MSKWSPFNGRQRKPGNVVSLPPPKPRHIDAVTRDYNSAALQLGHLEHQQHVTEIQIAQLHARMAELGEEAKVISEKAAADAKAKEAEAPKPEPEMPPAPA